MILNISNNCSLDNKVTLKLVEIQVYLLAKRYVFNKMRTFFLSLAYFSFIFIKLFILKRNYLRYECTEKEFNNILL